MTNPFPAYNTTPFPASEDPPAEEMLRTGEVARDVVEEIAGMLEALPDTNIPVPRSEWTVGEHGAHLAFANIGFGMFAMGLEYPYGDGTKAGLSEANDAALYGFPERGGPELAQHLVTATDNFLAQLQVRSPDDECPSPLGRMPLRTLVSYYLIHNLMHGCAISAALEHPFPTRPEHLPLVWPLILHALPNWVNESSKGISGCAQIEVGGVLGAAFEMEDSRLSILDAPTRPVDCYVEAEPIHFFLVMIKLLTVDEAVELGQMRVSGSDPGLFARIMNAIDVP
ncbi:MAG: DinB family protein [Actinomycetota bacterium]|nr:DinB family protein [Actinomycetota bacterium]